MACRDWIQHDFSLLFSLLLSLLVLIPPSLAGFGHRNTDSHFVIDAGSADPFVFSVVKRSCDISSIKYRNKELQSKTKNSHISSGLGSAKVTVNTIGTDYIKVECVTATLTHYMIVKSGESRIYMATYITAQPTIGELRFIARLSGSELPGEYPHGKVSKTEGKAIEGSDVFLVGKETRSKFYSSIRFIDEDIHCVHSETIYVCMVVLQQESSVGGPFFRDINSNNVGDTTNLYNYMNSGHAQTEKYRMGLHGPYVMTFSGTKFPSRRDLDTSFFKELKIEGYVPESGRGSVSGVATGVEEGQQGVVHWFNDKAQYWTRTAEKGGKRTFTSPPMKPGTYVMKLYQTEFEIGMITSVTVKAGSKTTMDIRGSAEPPTSPPKLPHSSPARHRKRQKSAIAEVSDKAPGPQSILFRIGTLDGQPKGFKNADKIERMHPSDARMDWKMTTYTVGTDIGLFPMAVFQAVNNPVKIKFDLKQDKVPKGEATLRIATTASFSGGRPGATINRFQAKVPPPPDKINSRIVTRGTWRGYKNEYYVQIPHGTLMAGVNEINISCVAKGAATRPGGEFLSPNFIFDAIELYTADGPDKDR